MKLIFRVKCPLNRMDVCVCAQRWQAGKRLMTQNVLEYSEYIHSGHHSVESS